jgi:hypothetical protein
MILAKTWHSVAIAIVLTLSKQFRKLVKHLGQFRKIVKMPNVWNSEDSQHLRERTKREESAEEQEQGTSISDCCH